MRSPGRSVLASPPMIGPLWERSPLAVGVLSAVLTGALTPILLFTLPVVFWLAFLRGLRRGLQ